MQSVVKIRPSLITYIFPALILLLAFLQIITPYRGWMILLVGFGGIWLFALAWARSLARGLKFTRETRFGWAHVGDILEERFTLSKKGSLPAIWVEVDDLSDMPDYHVSIGTGVGGDSENQWTSQHMCTRRGVYNLGPTLVKTGDPFGILNVTLEFPAFKTLLVLPQPILLPHLVIAQGGRAGEGHRQTTSFEQTVSTKGIRKYLPSDSVSHIHWPSVAHRDDYFVRLFENTPAGDWWIYLDLDSAEQAEFGNQSTLESGIILAASLAEQGLQGGRAVGLVLHHGDLLRLPPQWGQDQRWQIMRALALAKPASLPLSELLTNARPKSIRASSIIIITPSLNTEWLDALSPILALGAVPTVLLLDRPSFGGRGDAGSLLAYLGERGINRYLITPEMFLPRMSDGRLVRPSSAKARLRQTRAPDDDWKVLA
jgi:uncharacterized protein (DUF58 family)